MSLKTPLLCAALSVSFLLPPLGPTFAHAEEANTISVESSEVEVTEKSESRFSVTVDTIPVDTDAVVEFTAWYQAPKCAGYYAGLQVFWNDEELEDALDRPAEFSNLKGDRTIPTRRKKWWQVPVLPKPEAAHQPDNPYAANPDIIDTTRFRFPVNIAGPGSYELRFRNIMATDREGKYSYEIFPMLMLRDIRLRFVPKGDATP